MVDDEAHVEPPPLQADEGNPAKWRHPLLLLSSGHEVRAKLKCAQWATRQPWKQLQLALAPRRDQLACNDRGGVGTLSFGGLTVLVAGPYLKGVGGQPLVPF